MFVWFVVGILSGLFIRQRFPIKFKEELDLVPLIQLGVTLIVALLITHYARQRTDEQRVEKEIIIEQLRAGQAKCKEVFNDFSLCCEAGKADEEQKKKLIRLMREFSNLLSLVRKAIEYFGNQAQLVQQWINTQQSYFSFKVSVTEINPAADLRNPIFHNNAQIAWLELEDQLLRLIFEVNKS